MASQAYQYQSDSGVCYQVFLDDALASQLAYLPATGIEPYVPQSLSMRYATYFNSLTATWIQAYIANKALVTSLPPVVTANGLAYLFKSYAGESSAQMVGGAVMLIAGPQGERGPSGGGGGSIGTYSSVLGADINPVTTSYAVINSLTLPPGTYFLAAIADVLTDASGSNLIDLQLFDATNNVIVIDNGIEFAAPADRRGLVQTALYVVSATVVIQQRIKPGAADIYVYAHGPAGGSGSRLDALKVA